MESRKWASYRGRLYDDLIKQRPIIQNLRFECVRVARTFDRLKYNEFNATLETLFGMKKDYMHRLADAFWLQQHISPMWEPYKVTSAGEYFRISFIDTSVRNRDIFNCRFVSVNPAPVVVYAGLSLMLMDQNTFLEEITQLFEVSA